MLLYGILGDDQCHRENERRVVEGRMDVDILKKVVKGKLLY